MTTFGETADSFKQTGVAFTKAAEKAGKVFGEASDGAGLLPALLNDPVLRDDAKALVANLRSRGFLFYKNPPSEKPASAAPRRPSPPLAPSNRPPGRSYPSFPDRKELPGTRANDRLPPVTAARAQGFQLITG